MDVKAATDVATLETRVVILHNVLWAHYKGAVFSQLEKEAPAAGFRVHVIHLAETDRDRIALGAGVDRSIHNYSYQVLFPRGRRNLRLTSQFRILIRTLKQESPHILVVSGYHDPLYWLGLVWGKLTGTAVIVAIDSTAYDKPRKYWRELPKRLFVNFCDAAFGYGTRSREYCRALGMSNTQIFTRCQATDSGPITERFAEESAKLRAAGRRERRFLYVGRLSPEKNLHVVLRAFKRFLQISPAEVSAHWGIEFVGGGPEESSLRALVNGMRLPRVTFSSGVPWREVGAVFARADVLILASVSEPWGLVVNEAMACSVPVIVSTACGCAPDLVEHNVTGLLFEPSNAEALAGHMMTMATDDAAREQMGLSAKRHIAQFTPKAAALQMIHGFEHVRRRAELE
jgi:glycosyltransferase involved in cell wall biosynthesis